MKKSQMLLALTSSALAIPFSAGAVDAPSRVELGYGFTSYQEDAVSGGQSVDGQSHDRYDIVVNQFHVLLPLLQNQTLSFDVSRDVMSGASPWDIAQANGESKAIMSGASIAEQRTDGRIGWKKYEENRVQGVSVAVSTENDYRSLALAGDAEFHMNQRNTVLAVSGSVSSDDITPTLGNYQNQLDGVARASKTSVSVSASWVQALNPKTLIQSGITLTQHSGYLSDPYKMNDARPDARFQTALSLRSRHFLKDWNGALHLGYRFYKDDWAVRSDTFDIAWYQNLDAGYQLIPSLRYYSQDGAEFYQPTSANANSSSWISSDYRLAYYGAMSGGVKLMKRFVDTMVYGGIERYHSGSELALGSAHSDNPAALDYTRLSFGVEYTF